MKRSATLLERLRGLDNGITGRHFAASRRVIAGKSYPTRAYDAYDESEARAWIDATGAKLGEILPADHPAEPGKRLFGGTRARS